MWPHAAKLSHYTPQLCATNSRIRDRDLRAGWRPASRRAQLVSNAVSPGTGEPHAQCPRACGLRSQLAGARRMRSATSVGRRATSHAIARRPGISGYRRNHQEVYPPPLHPSASQHQLTMERPVSGAAPPINADTSGLCPEYNLMAAETSCCTGCLES